MSVDATAIVDPRATIHDSVFVGPYCVVGPDVEIGRDTKLLAHCCVFGPTRLGARNVVHPFAVLGGEPQDRGYAGEDTRLIVGDDSVFREHVTVHRGTARGGGTTRVGDSVLLMVGGHIAHDVSVGDHCTLTNATLLGGHVQLGDWVVTGGQVAVAPFVHVGESAFLAGGAMVESDVPPFVIAAGDRASVRALNRVGIERRGIPEESRRALKQAFRMIFRSKDARSTTIRVAERELGSDMYVARLIAFLDSRSPSSRPHAKPR